MGLPESRALEGQQHRIRTLPCRCEFPAMGRYLQWQSTGLTVEDHREGFHSVWEDAHPFNVLGL